MAALLRISRGRLRSLLQCSGGALLLLLPVVASVPSCVPPEGTPDTAALPIPFAVSDYFAPTGYLGDGATIGNVNMIAAACPSRAPGAVGDCYQVTYTPPLASTYAGVYWQYPGNNWGGYPGHTVLPGATQVTLQAMGAKGGEPVSFKVGGIAYNDDTKQYHDAISVSGNPVSLTTSWKPYALSFEGQTYSCSGCQVLGGFAWILIPPILDGGAPDTEPIVFYLDDIRWSQ